MIAKQTIDHRLQDFYQKARQRGIRITPQRLAIFKIVASSETHPGAEEIHQKLSTQYPMMSLDTVYRTLWLLEELGLVSIIGPRSGTLRFDANTRHHHHFTCLRCGCIVDFEDISLDAIEVPELVSAFGEAKSLRVEVSGICKKCLANPSAQAKQQKT